MKNMALGRYALAVCASVALLVACSNSGSQLPLSLAPQGLPLQQSLGHQTYNILHEFGSSAGDGTNPSAELINVKGTLYGTTLYGGANGAGTVFSITESGGETVLHSFGGSGDGGYPVAALLNVKGTLYGTTSAGGKNGSGTVFSITPGGAEKVLHSFDYNDYYNKNDGSVPHAGLINVNGTLYGTTEQGGAHYCRTGSSCGTVFSITTNGTYKVLHKFGKHDGAYPEAALLDVDGTLYGTTSQGGKYERGAVFSISTAGEEKTLYSFGASGFFDGTNPLSALIGVNGTLYGTTVQGGAHGQGGAVFSITTDGTENLVYSFDGSHGSQPHAGLIDVKGVLYGTTSVGGVKNVGTVFSTTTSGEEQVLHSFRAGGGENPLAGVIEVGGTLYGTTYGAANNHHGNVFSLTP